MGLKKMSLILSFAIALVLSSAKFSSAVCNDALSHDLCIGDRVEGDQLVLSKPVKVQKKGMFYHQELFSVPDKEEMTITRVEAEDQMTDNTGAFCQYIKGGVGKPNVTLEFSNMVDGKIDFVVKLYA